MTNTNYFRRGQTAVNLKDFPEAIRWFELAAKAEPKNAQILACLGQTNCWNGQQYEGLKLLKKSGRLLLKKAKKSKDISQLLLLAEQLQFWHDYQGSLEVLKSAQKINPDNSRVHQILALTYLRFNQTQAALHCGKKALRFAPDSPVLNILLASLESHSGDCDKALHRLKKVLTLSLSLEEAYRTHKELALVLDKCGKFEQVFEHLKKAEELSTNLPAIKRQDRHLVPAMIKDNQQGFNALLLQKGLKLSLTAKEEAAPVFLIGFFRSGTTLAQQVLGSHSAVFVADEPDLIAQTNIELKRISGNTLSQPKQLESLDPDSAEHLRDFYWSRAKGKYGPEIEGKLFIDKTTMNTVDIGLINFIFPASKVIFMIRDPRDICLSCYLQVMTPNPSTIHLINWHALAEFYALIMEWWSNIKEILTVDIVEIKYEDIVSEFETTFRGVLDFLNLQWEPSIKNFSHRAAKKAVISPSYHQVSKPLYQSSVGRWQSYQIEFNSALKHLQPFLHKYNYL